MRLICGKGYNSKGEYKTSKHGKRKTAYAAWYNMILRCYSPKYHKVQPTYIGCSVTNDWLDYQNFAEWYESHEFANLGYELDKDLLVLSNKIYSPKTCCLIPKELNALLLSRGNDRGEHPVGVIFNNKSGRYHAQISLNGKRKHLGSFKTSNEAYQAYKAAKVSHVKERALAWYPRIDKNVFDRLMVWEVEQ